MGDRSLGSLFSLDRPAPKTINGKMAMVGFVWALVAKKVTGLGVIDQLFNPSTSGLLWFGTVVQLFTLSSIIPFANGTKLKDFNATIESDSNVQSHIKGLRHDLEEYAKQFPTIKLKKASMKYKA